MVEEIKQNEETLKRYIEEYQSKSRKQEEKYQRLKQHALIVGIFLIVYEICFDTLRCTV